MSEQHFDETRASAELGGALSLSKGGTGAARHTGVARVDAVLETLDRLDELPLTEHVGVFEAAHTELRRALDPDSPAHDAMARVAAASAEPQRQSTDQT